MIQHETILRRSFVKKKRNKIRICEKHQVTLEKGQCCPQCRGEK